MDKHCNLSMDIVRFICQTYNKVCAKIELKYFLPVVKEFILYLPELSSLLGRNLAPAALFRNSKRQSNLHPFRYFFVIVNISFITRIF